MYPQDFVAAGPLNLGMPEILVIGLIAVMMFGGKKLPELAKGLGEGIKNFKQAVKSDDETPAAAPSVETKKQA